MVRHCAASARRLDNHRLGVGRNDDFRPRIKCRLGVFSAQDRAGANDRIAHRIAAASNGVERARCVQGEFDYTDAALVNGFRRFEKPFAVGQANDRDDAAIEDRV